MAASNALTTRIRALDSTISSEKPYERIEGQIYLDAQAAIQWMRLGVFDEALELVQRDDGIARVAFQPTAYHETIDFLCRMTGENRDQVKEYLKHPNIYVEGEFAKNTAVYDAAISIRNRILVIEGEKPRTAHARKHLGEAEILAVLSMFGGEGLFVTGDTGAHQAAAGLGVKAVRPLAFVAGLMRNQGDVSERWRFLCHSRDCRDLDGPYQGCLDALACSHLTEQSAERGLLNDRVQSAGDLVEWAHADVKALIRNL